MKLWVAGIEHARRQALILLEKFGVESDEHLRIEAFARRLGLELVEVPLDGAKAQLVVGPSQAQIQLSEQLTDPVERRWSIAHELGHFVLGHPSSPATGLDLPHRKHRRADRRDYEGEANGFASALLFQEPIVASVCDTWPMTLDVVWWLAELCRVPWAASAMHLAAVTWRTCAVIVSQGGVIRGIWPSLPFLMLCGGRIWPEQAIGPGALARRYFETSAPCGEPALVPASAWLAGCGSEVRIQEHSIEIPELGTVVTMLWDAAEADTPRPPEATLRAVAMYRDQLLAEWEDHPVLGRIQA